MSVNDFHIRMDSTLDKQVEQQAILRRTSKNQLVIGILQRALNPNPNDEQTIFRRLDRVEKSILELEKAVRALVQNHKAFQDTYTKIHRNIENTLASCQNETKTLRSDLEYRIQALRVHVDHEIQTALRTSAQRYQECLRDLIAYAATEGRGVLRRIGEHLSGSMR